MILLTWIFTGSYNLLTSVLLTITVSMDVKIGPGTAAVGEKVLKPTGSEDLQVPEYEHYSGGFRV